MRSFQGNGVQGNRVGLGKQPLSLAKKRISRKLQVRLPRDFQSLAMTVRSIEIATAFSKPRNDNKGFAYPYTTYCHSEKRRHAFSWESHYD